MTPQERAKKIADSYEPWTSAYHDALQEEVRTAIEEAIAEAAERIEQLQKERDALAAALRAIAKHESYLLGGSKAYDLAAAALKDGGEEILAVHDAEKDRRIAELEAELAAARQGTKRYLVEYEYQDEHLCRANLPFGQDAVGAHTFAQKAVGYYQNVRLLEQTVSEWREVQP